MSLKMTPLLALIQQMCPRGMTPETTNSSALRNSDLLDTQIPTEDMWRHPHKGARGSPYVGGGVLCNQTVGAPH